MDKEVANQIYQDINEIVVSMPTIEVVESLLLILAETTYFCSGDVGPNVMSKKVMEQYLKYIEAVKVREALREKK